MKEIKLTQGKVALVDDDDFEYLNQWKWCACKFTHTWYALRVKKINGISNKIYMHGLIMNKNIKVKVDHFNHDGLDNQKKNLRICTHKQNCYNSRPKKGFKYKGVSFLKDTNKWASYIKFNYKKISLGRYHTEIEAAKAYNEKAKELFGEFAYLNII
jgi:hypothetical protein